MEDVILVDLTMSNLDLVKVSEKLGNDANIDMRIIFNNLIIYKEQNIKSIYIESIKYEILAYSMDGIKIEINPTFIDRLSKLESVKPIDCSTVDEILDRINIFGINLLTKNELRILENSK